MSASPSSLFDRAATAPARVLVALALVAVTATTVVAGHRHGASAPAASVADAAAEVPPAHEPAVRRDVVSRSGDRRHGATTAAVRRAAPLVRKPIPTMPEARSDAAETVAAAEASAYNIPGHCLGWAREQADIPSRYADAATAWEHARGRHPGDLTPPEGAAVYWLGGSGGHGHVAISVGGGLVRSSDAGGYGVVATVPLRRLTREWHLTYVGWSDSVNGYRIPGVART
ncbi:hypothetical protein [Nocardioides conyzicola]|uniref:CHAP domain-containing protein n=1 Tax=Nocardioides conyzicola TaxID=1651781 RepID=A0ABP8X6Y8_9ACTN